MRNDVLIKCGRYALRSIVVGAIAVTACARTDAKPPDADSAASASGAGFTIPAAQRARLHVLPVVLSVFRPVVATT
ncbi:MAG TPA: hypothetical protein VF836_08955, partial [Gemmatimonadaceae bacterium]